MNEQEVLQILGRVGAVVTDSHIVYTSGKHGTAYINKDAVYPHTAETSRLCKLNVPINTAVGKGREFLAHKQA